jgi:hypothetical protein
MKKLSIVFWLLMAACSPAIEENYYIPENYEGIVTIAFGDSINSSNIHEYQIPESGMILTPYKLPKRINGRHFYYHNKSKPIRFSPDPREPFEGTQVSSYETGISRSDNSRTNVYYVQFIVSTYENRKTYYVQMNKLNIGNLVDSIRYK